MSETRPDTQDLDLTNPQALTDLGNGQLFAEMWRDQVVWVPEWGHWAAWDEAEGRWIRNGDLYAERMAKETAKHLFLQAAQYWDDDKRMAKKIADWALKAHRAHGQGSISAMLTMARSEPGMSLPAHEFDRNPWRLNTLAAVVDLKTGDVLPQSPIFRITMRAETTYRPKARHELWDRFLQETIPDPEVRSFVQRAVGYTLTGLTTEEVLFFVHGPTATGKSTFLEAIRATLGDYARRADFETFLAKKYQSGPRNDIARLAGSRMVVSLEMTEGRKLAEGLVKQLTGGDTVAARFLHREFFEFRPTFKLWLCANSKPRVRDDDEAMWRRILLIPFEQEIPEEKRDPVIKQILTTDLKAREAILAWAVRGCLEWQERGLDPPQAVRGATTTYRCEMDPLQAWLEECCEIEPEAWTPSRELWESYRRFEPRGLPRRKFLERLKKEGFKPEKGTHGARVWRGLRLVETERPAV
jgi:putative DNA primase/helicase